MTKYILYEGKVSRVPSLLLKPAYFQGILSEVTPLGINISKLKPPDVSGTPPSPPPPRLSNDLKT